MRQEKLFNGFQIILGSKSPRRSELLKRGQIPFTKVIREVKEVFPSDLIPQDVPEFLAVLKASAFDDHLTENQLLICADTIVIQNDRVIGKPKDTDHAVKTLQALSNAWHTVVSGVCLKTSKAHYSFSQISQVKFYALTPAEIDYYISEFKPFDKAGAYGIQDWIGINKIEEIQGSYTNIMGLPMGKLYHELCQITTNL